MNEPMNDIANAVDSYPRKFNAVAHNLYKVAREHRCISIYVVKAGNGSRILFKGSKANCELVARQLTGAFLDGGFYHHSLYMETLRAAKPKVDL